MPLNISLFVVFIVFARPFVLVTSTGWRDVIVFMFWRCVAQSWLRRRRLIGETGVRAVGAEDGECDVRFVDVDGYDD